MDKLTDFTDTSDVSDAAIEWVIKASGGSDSVEYTRERAPDDSYTVSRSRIMAARLIQQHRPDLLVDPVDAIVLEELAKANEAAGYTHIAATYRKGIHDDHQSFEAAKRLYLMGLEAGKNA